VDKGGRWEKRRRRKSALIANGLKGGEVKAGTISAAEGEGIEASTSFLQ